MLYKRPGLRLFVRNPCPLLEITKPDREYTDAFIGMKLFRQLYWFAFLVFAVGEKYNRFVFVRFADECFGCCFNRNTQLRSANRNRMRPDGVENLFEVVIVARQRHRLIGFPGKHNQANSIARHLVNHVLDLLLGSFQSTR